jgi:hypothetical protein
MARNNSRTVYLRSDGLWANKSNAELRASGTHALQAEAAAEARTMLLAAGGGDLTIKSETGTISSRESILPHPESPPPESASPTAGDNNTSMSN